MSRQLKKKSTFEKKKKRAAQENKNATKSSEVLVTSEKSSGAIKPLKSKQGKISAAKTVKSDRIQKIRNFFMEVKLELSKVIWPTKKQVSGSTLVVIIFVLIISVFLGLFDLGLSTLVQVFLT